VVVLDNKPQLLYVSPGGGGEDTRGGTLKKRDGFGRIRGVHSPADRVLMGSLDRCCLRGGKAQGLRGAFCWRDLKTNSKKKKTP